ncbi:MAG: TetR/AcrR family transcriptional regulator [Bacillaceae bacterium]|nr:TetR/AcrR family transcriptional regulator [Bacillaceae bacterium]
MPKVSEEYKEKKRNQILDSAMDCFAEKGYKNTTMDDIVKQSGMSKGALYNYFKSKEDIYLSLLERNTDRTFEYFQKGFTEAETATEKLRRLLSLYYQMDHTDQDWLGRQRVYLEFWIDASMNDELRQSMMIHSEKFIHFLKEIVEEGKEKGEFRKDIDSQMISEAFWAMNDGVRLHLLVSKDQYPFQKMHKLIDQLFLDLIKVT